MVIVNVMFKERYYTSIRRDLAYTWSSLVGESTRLRERSQ